MVFRKAIIQVYSGTELFGFDDFVRGTLRLFNYAIDHNIDVKINVSGSEFEQYMIVNNYIYDNVRITPKVYYMNVDQDLLIQNLNEFMASTDPIFVVTSNIWLDRNDIYNLSYVGFDSLVRYKESLYIAAEEKVRANLLYRPQNDNLLYGYSIIYLHRDSFHFKTTARNIASLAIQIRRSLDMNRDMMLFSNSIQLRLILSQYIEMNSAAVQRLDESEIDIGPNNSLPTMQDIMIDFIILLKSKKIYRFSDCIQETEHNINFTQAYDLQHHNKIIKPLTNIYEAAYDINNIIGNLEETLIPLYYQTRTIIGSASISSILNNPSGIAIDSSGSIYIADTNNHCIRRLDTSGNLTIYAGSGIPGYRNGGPTIAQFNTPTALAVDMAGNLYVADTENNAVRIIERNYVYDSSNNIIAINGIIGTLIGNGPTNFNPTTSSGTGTKVLLSKPRGVAVDASGCVYISDTGHNRICKVISGGNLITLAGSTAIDVPDTYLPGFINGEGIEAAFNTPCGLTVDLLGNVFVADSENNVIRKITPNGKVTTVAGSGQMSFKEGRKQEASFNKPIGITIDLHNVLYVADSGNNVIRQITKEGNVIPVVGSPQQKPGSIDGYGAIDPMRALVPFPNRATFNSPSAITVDSSRRLYVADSLNNTIRRIVPTFSTPTKIRPIAIQALRITHAPGVAYTLGPTLSAGPPHPNTIILGHRRGHCRR